jgi:hypothetical protein
MNTQENRRHADGESIPESEPLVVVRSNVGQYVSKQDDAVVKTASEPLASFTMKCSKPHQGQ